MRKKLFLKKSMEKPGLTTVILLYVFMITLLADLVPGNIKNRYHSIISPTRL